MKGIFSKQLKFLCVLLLFTSITIPSHGFLWWGEKEPLEETQSAKEVIVGSTLLFVTEDFSRDKNLKSITFEVLPRDEFGLLYYYDTPIQAQEVIVADRLEHITFQTKSTLGTTEFRYFPTFLDGTRGASVTVTLMVLDRPNIAPTVRDMDLFTYKNIAITCYFDVNDPESDFLTFQIVDPPARGSVTLSDNGASSFLYTPYENKVGKDSFRYVVTDSSGNISNEGTVRIKIEKADTPVVYSDMDGHSAHKAAISLAESGVFVGECLGNTYLFHPDQPVSREEFVSLAMAVAQLSPLDNATKTGFYDDDSISTWSKGYVSSALMAGVIQGGNDSDGRAVFQGDAIITMGEASVILDQLLDTNEVTEVVSYHWASQASANLSAVGVNASAPLPASLNRGEVAEMLDATLSLLESQNEKWFSW